MNSTGRNFIEILKTREPGTISQLYDCYAPALYGSIFRIVKSHTAAEQILEHTFLRTIEDIDQLTNSAVLFTTMHGIARASACENVLLNTLNNREISTHPDDQINAVSYTELMEGMEYQCGEVVRHLYLEGHSLTHTSQTLAISADKVKTQLRSGLAHIHRKINGSQNVLGATVITSPLIQF